MKLKNILLTVILPLMTINCATIVHGTKQKINFVSSPPGASVSIDNENKGQTPVVLKLKRKDDHFVQMRMPGYHPFEISLIQKPDYWIVGNAFFGAVGLIGLIVDMADSAMYQLKPEKNASFKGATFTKDETKKGTKVLSVNLSPDASAALSPQTEPQPTSMPQTVVGSQTTTGVPSPTPAQQPSQAPPPSPGVNPYAPYMIPASQVPNSGGSK